MALIQYLMMPDRLHILLTLRDGSRAFQSEVPAEELNAMVQTFRDSLRQRPGAAADTHLTEAQALYQRLLAPVAAELQAAGVSTLMLFLDGSLRYLPFAALHDGEGYLIEHYALAVHTAINDINLDDPPQSDWRVAGFGVSKGHQQVGPSRRNFGRLPAVPGELEGIVKRSAGDADGVLPGSIYLDSAFTRASLGRVLRNGRYPVIHLATHFAMESGEDNSFLVLGDGTALTLRQLRQQARISGVDLVVLSACDTAVKLRAYAGIEVEGLGTVIQGRGAKGVIATLWSVEDASTGLFMRRFYDRRQRQGLNKAEALRQAQIELIRGTSDASGHQPRGFEQHPIASQASAATGSSVNRGLTHGGYAHPHYWAPFILMGNWL